MRSAGKTIRARRIKWNNYEKETNFIFLIFVLIIVATAVIYFQYGTRIEGLLIRSAILTPTPTETPILNPDEYQPPLPSIDGVALGNKLMGDWQAKSEDEADKTCKTGYEVKFSEENGKKVYQSWQHCRPLESGTWSLDGDTITINTQTQTNWQEKVYIENENTLWFGNVGQFERTSK